jgi:hypothetical protein
MAKFLADVLTGTSVSEASKAAKISMTTALYWMNKIFAALASWQSSITLSGGVYVDEKYLAAAHSEVELRPDGKRCRGLSRNRRCVAVALGPEKKAMATAEGKGKSSSGKVLDAFKNHISPGSTLIHDLDFSHYELIEKLRLADEGEKAIYKFNGENSLDPINRYRSNMEDFVRLQRGHEQASASGLDEPLRAQIRVPGECPAEGRKTAGFASEMQRNRQIPRLNGRFSPTPCMGVIKIFFRCLSTIGPSSAQAHGKMQLIFEAYYESASMDSHGGFL